MDSRQLRYMLEIEKHANISRAAESLYMTQSALNQQLLKIEEEMGTQLFERKGKRMIPTQAGYIYLQNAREMLARYEDTCAQIQSLSKEPKGELNIAVTPEYGVRLFSSIYPVFHQSYPMITFRMREERTRAIEKLLLNKEVSIAFSTTCDGLEDSRLQYHIFHEEEICLAVPNEILSERNTGVSESKDLPVMDASILRKIPFSLPGKNTQLRQQVDRFFQYHHVRPNVLVECSYVSALVDLLSSQLCATFLPASYISSGLPAIFVPLAPKEYIKRCTVLLSEHVMSAPERKLMELANKRYAAPIDRTGPSGNIGGMI